MIFRNGLPLPLAVLGGVLLGALMIWAFQYAWEKAGEYDANPRRATMKNQLMRHKADAMDDVLHQVLRGRLNRVAEAATRMRKSADAIDGFLSTDVYKNFGDDFYQAIDEVKTAAGAGDRDGVKAAVLRLEKSCIECHFLINQPN